MARIDITTRLCDMNRWRTMVVDLRLVVASHSAAEPLVTTSIHDVRAFCQLIGGGIWLRATVGGINSPSSTTDVDDFAEI